MYFENRRVAGDILAGQLFDEYRWEDCAIIALNSGGVLVAEPIAEKLHSVLTMLLSEEITIPSEDLVLGEISQNGNFVKNRNLSDGQFNEYSRELFNVFEQLKREKIQKINRLIGDGGTISLDLLRGRNIIVVSDGFIDSSTIDVVLDFIKPIEYRRIIAASPVASIKAVDRLHVSADEIHILDVKNNYLDTNHYYDDNNVPPLKDVINKISNIVLNWK